MEQKLLIFLLGFEVVLKDRRNGEESKDFMVVPATEEHPEELEDAYDTIRRHYSRLGYITNDIEYQHSKVMELDLKAEYEVAQKIEDYEGNAQE